MALVEGGEGVVGHAMKRCCYLSLLCFLVSTVGDEVGQNVHQLVEEVLFYEEPTYYP